ncbi:type I-E CRISPR-associated protein Cse2/CasB [Kitasatospora kifunensis]|uniref:CRISPR system Cascade subunit CasA n=1 Tax=Kitasatospora kifunensis TaxID=58351 RepID=A0A7W7RBL5_KITKI|nr:type I-E CRISPR-associated protein Cse2/CasB [Kitasatospora kifunensis]MBB4928850.1 CRISPR system Cascade subunit CasA [Kitasatospora kifunensis]
MTDRQETTAEAGSPAPAPEPKPPGVRLTGWLCGLVVSRQLGALADLRRPTALTDARFKAENFAPEEDQHMVFAQVAFLFARYHAGARTATPGYGNMGAALRLIGSGATRGPADPGATRLLDRLVASRTVPWRHLQHAVERARACETQPPSWDQLTQDLARWNARGDARTRSASRGRPVPYAWARSFYTPNYTPNFTNGGTT